MRRHPCRNLPLTDCWVALVSWLFHCAANSAARTPDPQNTTSSIQNENNMKYKLSFTTALVALGIISSASAAVTNELHVTGSTAFRGNFFTAATAAAGGIFDAPGATALPAGANSGSGLITYVGKIGGVNYALECSWTGSEAGIANVDGVGT